MQNIRKRKDGRYEWRKQFNLTKYTLIDKNKKTLEKKVRELLKNTFKVTPKEQNKKTKIELVKRRKK